MTSPAWNGMQIPRGRILLVGDQGYGDTIQFARYIPLVAERCQEVVLGCSAELADLLRNVPGVAACYARWDAIPPHAAHCRLSSLPLMFQTTMDNIPGTSPYLAADPARVTAWAERLGAPCGPRIGLAWTGRPTHPNDMRRSLALERLLPLTDAASCQFVALQKPVPARDEAVMARFPGLTDLSAALTDFAETAALIANLDLVVTIDSAVGHLAGALGKPAWVMLAKAADWRWMLTRTDTPWYPTLRLFRQQTPGAMGCRDRRSRQRAAERGMEVIDDGAEVAEVIASGLVDAPWYMACHPDVGRGWDGRHNAFLPLRLA